MVPPQGSPRWRPAQPYTRASATAKAKALHPGAFCKEAKDSVRTERCQVLVEEYSPSFTEQFRAAADQVARWKWNPDVYLVASGPDWMTALERFHDWMEEHHGEEKED